MRRIQFVFTLVCVLFMTATLSFAADVAKIGVFDFGRILESSIAGRDAQKELNEQGKRMADDLKQKGNELEELKKRIERESLVLTEEKRNEKERDFRIRVNDLKELQRQYGKEAKEIQEKLKRSIDKDVRAIINDIGKTQGFLLIMEINRAGVYYHPTPLDITDDIIRRYNDVYQKKAGAASE